MNKIIVNMYRASVIFFHYVQIQMNNGFMDYRLAIRLFLYIKLVGGISAHQTSPTTGLENSLPLLF